MLPHTTHTMTNMTLAVPEGLRKEMMLHTEIKWSDIARRAFEKKIQELHWMDNVLARSTITQRDADNIGHQIKSEIRKRFS